MLISLNELKKLVNIAIPDDELFRLVGSRLVEIEGVEDWSRKFKKAYVVKVISAEPVEGTHLSLCKIDAGAKLNAEVDPEHAGYVQVVCGAPNVKAGMFTAWLAPGAIVPSTSGTSEEFTLSARPLRGMMSFGMLAAADELALGSDHAGIVELAPDLAEPGTPLADALDLNDKIIEVENKSLTHRPDCFGLIGFAREVAGVLGQPFTAPVNIASLTAVLEAHSAKTTLPLEVEQNIDAQLCPYYQALVFDFAHLPTREDYLTLDDIFLIKAGMRPISPLVDATNRIMLMTGQPLHAFDYDKFLAVGGSETPKIGVRLAREQEKLRLLDDSEIELNENDILITSSDVPVALAGAMGGESTEIDEHTKRIIVEIASFSLYNLRKTQMSHGIFSEAITRFTKGRPATDLAPATELSFTAFADLGGVYAGAAQSGDAAFVDNAASVKPTIEITVAEINALLGADYSKELIIKTLENVEFGVEQSDDDKLQIVAPAWRSDIHIKEDIIEEVGRLLGFDNLPIVPPMRPFRTASLDPLLTLKSRLRNILSDQLGAHEVLTYSFVSKKLQEKAGEDIEDSYKIVNSISPALECFRQSLIPSLLEKAYENLRAGHKDFTLYELNQITRKSFGLNAENVPVMQTELGLTTFGDFYRAKAVLTALSERLNLPLALRPLEKSALFAPAHSAEIVLATDAGEVSVGTLGEIRASVLKSFKLPAPIAALSLMLDQCLSALAPRTQNTKAGTAPRLALSRFPFVSRDLTVRVPLNAEFEIFARAIRSALEGESLIYKFEPVSIFAKENDDKKNLSFHLEIAHAKKTLESAEISDIIEKITKQLSALGGEVV